MSIRKRNRKTSNRRDSSTPTLPIATAVTIDAIAGGITMDADEGLIANKEGANSVNGISLRNSAGTFSNGSLIATQLDQFSVSLTHPDLAPGVFDGTVTLSPGNTGIRSGRGGTPVIPTLVF